MWVVSSADWLLTFKRGLLSQEHCFHGVFSPSPISPVFKKNTTLSPPILYIRCPKSLGVYSRFRHHSWRSLCLYQIIFTAFPSGFFFPFEPQKDLVHKKLSRTRCVSRLFSFIGTSAKICCVSNLGCGRRNLVWCTCWLLKLTALIFLMHTCLPPKLLLDMIWTLVLACKPKWFPLCAFQSSPCLWVLCADLFVSQAAASMYLVYRNHSSSCNLLNNWTMLSLWCVFIESFV